MDPLPHNNNPRVLLYWIPIAMVVSMMLADIEESSSSNRAHPRVSLHPITCGLATYTYHKSWPSPRLIAL
ncbi:Uncharacterized protein TCM_044106 [Theobroma cacao]|uniref:Uncharacterized protein n=1 Tax=Theobroma cacao TaxID=3641 RepID=A0A061FQP3_THECC|nr:Uncharacterized protein TCM_044106 [Theobroma cacao]